MNKKIILALFLIPVLLGGLYYFSPRYINYFRRLTKGDTKLEGYSGKVLDWNNRDGILRIVDDSTKLVRTYTLDPTQMDVALIDPQKKDPEFINSKLSAFWNNAFCVNDDVTLTLASVSGKSEDFIVRQIYNFGPNECQIK